MKRLIKKSYRSFYKFAIILLLMVSFKSFAVFEASPDTKVHYINQFASWINGSIVVKLVADGTICKGYFIDNTSSSHENVLSILMAAKLADANVQVMGITSSLWPGSTQTYCEIHSVNIM